MKYIPISHILDSVNTYGRTFVTPQQDVLYFNWSASTLEFQFSGSSLSAFFTADCGYEFEGIPMDPNCPKRPTWPVVAVFVDDATVPCRTFKVNAADQTWTIFQSEDVETHRIRITKLTENNKTFLGLRGFYTDGDIEKVEKIARPRMEIVGDSITCGYGNLVKDPGRHFFSCDEDGWNSYGPMAARNLGFEFSSICVSGITAVKHQGWHGDYAMEELYAYTDRIYQAKLGLEPEKWDFDHNKNDYVVINLGTNDCFGILFSPDEGELQAFTSQYAAFIRQVRKLNGPDTKIICALGTMNYYLYQDICKAVELLQEENPDPNLHVFRFRPIHPFDGLGADTHPSMATHEKMAKELESFIKTL